MTAVAHDCLLGVLHGLSLAYIIPNDISPFSSARPLAKEERTYKVNGQLAVWGATRLVFGLSKTRVIVVTVGRLGQHVVKLGETNVYLGELRGEMRVRGLDNRQLSNFGNGCELNFGSTFLVCEVVDVTDVAVRAHKTGAIHPGSSLLLFGYVELMIDTPDSKV